VHKKHSRELVPTEQCDQVIACVPTDCRKCGGDLNLTDSEPIRHQVWELPPIKPIVTEYLIATMKAKFAGESSPSLLPTTSQAAAA